jgi:hypothetical protein
VKVTHIICQHGYLLSRYKSSDDAILEIFFCLSCNQFYTVYCKFWLVPLLRVQRDELLGMGSSKTAVGELGQVLFQPLPRKYADVVMLQGDALEQFVIFCPMLDFRFPFRNFCFVYCGFCLQDISLSCRLSPRQQNLTLQAYGATWIYIYIYIYIYNFLFFIFLFFLIVMKDDAMLY